MRFARTAVVSLTASAALVTGSLSNSGPVAVAAAPGDVVITEVMQNPSAVLDSAGEWFELTNVTDTAIDINGWTIADNDIDTHVIDNGGPLVIPACGVVVLGNNTDPATNGGLTVDYSYGGSWFLANGADEVVLFDEALAEIDRIEYDGGPSWPDPTGAAMSLIAGSADNSVGANWETATSPYGSGDAGTPGSSPFQCGDGPTPVINEWSANVVGSDTQAAEYIEIYAAATTDLSSLTVVEIEGDGTGAGTIDGVFAVGTTDEDGLYLIDLPANELENGTVTLLLVDGFTGALGDDLDTDDDGVLDAEPWSDVVDGVATFDGGSSDVTYAVTLAGGFDGLSSFPPGGASRIPDGVDTDSISDWVRNDFDGFGLPGYAGTAEIGEAVNTPGAPNEQITVLPPTEYKIHEIQGEGAAVTTSEPVEVQGVVTALFTRDDVLDGFFVQEEDADADANVETSEGIFVFCRGVCPTIATGDLTTVTGTPGEFFAMSQIDATGGTISIVESNQPLPTPVAVDLPSGSSFDVATYEAVEGMHVTFSDTLVVSEYFELARYGQIVLTESSRPYQFTHTDAPSVAGYEAFLADLASRRVILDDDNNDQNDAISDGPDEAFYYPEGGLSTGNRFRGGDTIDGLSGVMHWSFAGQRGTDAWRIRPIPDAHEYVFMPTNPAPESAADVGGSMTVASFNVLNLFSTIDETSSNSSGPCGPAADQDCRGADSIAELERQQAKIAAAIAEIDAAIVGLIELENDGDDQAASDLVDVINSLGAGPYDVLETGFIGTDAIKVGLIYQPALVTPIGDFAILDESVDPDFLDSKNRPALVQSFVENASAGVVTVAVNHLKSKGSPCDDVGDPDIGDGQANCSGTREKAAIALANFLAGDPTGVGDSDSLILGDLNSYAMEDPIVALETAGYTDLLEAFVGPDAYTYVFDGQLGYLDYALANGSLIGQVTGADSWSINADEIPVFDYNDAVADTGEATFERETSVGDLFDPDPLRSSDHDPVIVGTELDGDIDVVLGFVAAVIEALADDEVINRGQEAALLEKIEQVLSQIERGKLNGAGGILTGLSEQLGDFVEDGVLTADQAAPLIQLIDLIRSAIAG